MVTRLRSRGFTIIELILLLVILGVLAAAFLPRFFALDSQARVGTVNATAGAVASAVSMAAARCALVNGCNVANWSVPVLGPQGQLGTMYNGYPTGQSRVPSYFGIKDWVTVQGVEVHEVSTAMAHFRVPGAPDPLTCMVVYREASSFGMTPTITTVTSGC